jgi:hypothetical protein
MRNYITVFVSQWNAPSVGKSGHAIGPTQGDANGRGAIFANNNAPGDPSNSVVDLGKYYACLDRSAIIGYITGGPVTNDSIDEQFFTNMSSLSAAEGLKPGESPIHSRDWPTSDGAKFKSQVTFTKKNVLGKQTLSLGVYLEFLLATWSSGITQFDGTVVTAPKRWLDWLAQLITLYESGKFTPTQVYAFLNLVDFSSSTPPLR